MALLPPGHLLGPEGAALPVQHSPLNTVVTTEHSTQTETHSDAHLCRLCGARAADFRFPSPHFAIALVTKAGLIV